jgi:hypothetical protein
LHCNLARDFVAALPFAREDYRRDFADAASVAEFDSLLAQAERAFVIPLDDDRLSSRPERYAQVGIYVARHSHVLLALWNGHTPHKVGGTAEVVRCRRVLTPMTTWTENQTVSVAARRAVVDDWVRGQRDYFTRAARRDRKLLQTHERRTTWLFVLSLARGSAVAFGAPAPHGARP